MRLFRPPPPPGQPREYADMGGREGERAGAGEFSNSPRHGGVFGFMPPLADTKKWPNRTSGLDGQGAWDEGRGGMRPENNPVPANRREERAPHAGHFSTGESLCLLES